MSDVKCMICGQLMKSRINGSHLKRRHNISLDEYRVMFPGADEGKYICSDFTCLVCGETTSGNSEIKSCHLKYNHGLTVDEYNQKYLIKYCACGCGEICTYSYSHRSYNDYVEGHHVVWNKGFTKIENPEFYSDKNLGGWNRGLTIETDSRLLEMSIKLKELWSNGTIDKEKVKENYKKKMLETYGVDNFFKTDEFRKYIVDYNLKRYGVPSQMQATEVFVKAQKSMRHYKDYICPSGKIRRIQGYEDLALDLLFKTYEEDDIIDTKFEIPDFFYMDIDGIRRRYFPDLYIPKENKIIEIKSWWTYNLDMNNGTLERKKKCVIDSGFEYQIWIFNNRKEKQLTILT